MQNDLEFRGKIKEFRVGELGTDSMIADRYPLCFTTVASDPEVDRESISTADTPDTLPTEQRILEFWIIIVVGNLATPERTQKRLYELSADVQEILKHHITLKDTDGTDPLAINSRIYTQRRFEQHKGSLLEAMTIRLRSTIIV